jgi:hypothetical protein
MSEWLVPGAAGQRHSDRHEGAFPPTTDFEQCTAALAPEVGVQTTLGLTNFGHWLMSIYGANTTR